MLLKGGRLLQCDIKYSKYIWNTVIKSACSFTKKNQNFHRLLVLRARMTNKAFEIKYVKEYDFRGRRRSRKVIYLFYSDTIYVNFVFNSSLVIKKF